MELRHLRYFCAVAEHQSFTLAARRLHVSQSGVSGQVRDLEREIGVKLLQRTPREVSLTPEGAVFLREAREILKHSERAVELALRASRGQFGKLTIGLCGPATAPFLPRLIRSFRKSQPGVNISLKDVDPMHQPELLSQGAIDIGFTRSMPPQFRSLLHSEVLFSEPLVAVLPKGHPHVTSRPFTSPSSQKIALSSTLARPHPTYLTRSSRSVRKRSFLRTLSTVPIYGSRF